MVKRRTQVVTGAAVAAAVGWAARHIPAALGAKPSGSRRERILTSPQYRDGAFHNSDPAVTLPAGSARRALLEARVGWRSRRPAGRLPVFTPLGPDDRTSSQDALYVTWYGHASALVEMDGARVLIDPVWGARCSPSPVAGPRRLHRVPIPLRQLPSVDAIVISHDHYDHLDESTVRALLAMQSAPFVVPLGVGAHLERWGTPPSRIIELDWNDSTSIGNLVLTATPAQHFSGRGLGRNTTLWASWVIAGNHRRVFYSGDSGYFTGWSRIGAEHGPFDVTLLQVGAYGAAWPDIHMTPEEAVRTHLDLRGGLLVPVHWGTFCLAFHAWSEPVERLWREAKARDVRLAVPRPGERVDVAFPPAVDAWWQAVA